MECVTLHAWLGQTEAEYTQQQQVVLKATQAVCLAVVPVLPEGSLPRAAGWGCRCTGWQDCGRPQACWCPGGGPTTQTETSQPCLSTANDASGGYNREREDSCCWRAGGGLWKRGLAPAPQKLVLLLEIKLLTTGTCIVICSGWSCCFGTLGKAARKKECRPRKMVHIR